LLDWHTFAFSARVGSENVGDASARVPLAKNREKNKEKFTKIAVRKY